LTNQKHRISLTNEIHAVIHEVNSKSIYFHSNVLAIKPQMELGGEETQSQEELVEDPTEDRGAARIFALIMYV
jgi:hypothetical protein